MISLELLIKFSQRQCVLTFPKTIELSDDYDWQDNLSSVELPKYFSSAVRLRPPSILIDADVISWQSHVEDNIVETTL